MKINLNQKIKELDGKDTENLTIGKAMANIILLNKKDPLRCYVLAQKLFTEDEFDLTKADQEFIKETIIEHGYTMYGNALVHGQLLLMLSELKG